MEEAERIAREEHGSIKLAVISGMSIHSFPSSCVTHQVLDHYSAIGCAGLIYLFAALGVGTRDYYRKLGYKLDGPYMSKRL